MCKCYSYYYMKNNLLWLNGSTKRFICRILKTIKIDRFGRGRDKINHLPYYRFESVCFMHTICVTPKIEVKGQWERLNIEFSMIHSCHLTDSAPNVTKKLNVYKINSENGEFNSALVRSMCYCKKIAWSAILSATLDSDSLQYWKYSTYFNWLWSTLDIQRI